MDESRRGDRTAWYQSLGSNETDAASIGLGLLSAAIAAAVVSPLLWILLRASSVDPVRAWDLLTWGRTAEITATSIGLVAVVTAGSIAVGVPLAFLTTRTDLRYRRFWTIVAALPLVIPSYIGAFAFVSMFGTHGEISSLFGVSLPTIDGFRGAALIITLYTYPYVFLTTRAALLAIDPSLLAAARSLNEDWRGTLRRVTLPQIRAAIAAGALLTALYAISDFGTPAFMRVRVFTSAIYWEYGAFNVEYAALLSLQLLAVAAVILAIEARVGSEPPGRTRGEATRLELGRWQLPAMTGIALLGAVTLLAPVLIFLRWLWLGSGGEVAALEFELIYAINSFYLAGAAAVIAAVCALPVAYFAIRSRNPIGMLLERGTYIGFAVPGIVIGLALVFFGANYAPWIYRTVPLLVFAYVVRFLPQAVGITRTSILQVDPQLVEAARTLDTSRVRAFTRVTLPLILPGVIAGGALVFLTTMKELPATLMLQPVGMETLVTIIWAAHEGLYYRYAAIPALVLILISGLSMLILISMEEYELS